MAKMESCVNSSGTMSLDSGGRHVDWPRAAILGPGALGSLKCSSSYKCSGYSLEYGSTSRADAQPNCVIKMRRVEEEDFGELPPAGQPVGQPKPDKSKGSPTPPPSSPKPTSPKLQSPPPITPRPITPPTDMPTPSP